MGHVGVVAGVLDHAGGGLPGAQPALGQVEARLLAARQADRHRIGNAAGQQPDIGGLGRRRGAGPGGPAAAQLAGRFASHRARGPQSLLHPAIGSGYSARAMTEPIFRQAPGFGKRR